MNLGMEVKVTAKVVCKARSQICEANKDCWALGVGVLMQRKLPAVVTLATYMPGTVSGIWGA